MRRIARDYVAAAIDFPHVTTNWPLGDEIQKSDRVMELTAVWDTGAIERMGVDRFRRLRRGRP